MDTRAVTVPAWAVPDGQQLRDLLAVTAGHTDERARGAADAVDWVTGWPVTWDQAGEEMTEAVRERKTSAHRGGVADAIAWLMGITSFPPVDLPRRNPDGTVVTADQLYAELLAEHPAGWKPTPEQRHAARQKADATAARWARLL